MSTAGKTQRLPKLSESLRWQNHSDLFVQFTSDNSNQDAVVRVNDRQSL